MRKYAGNMANKTLDDFIGTAGDKTRTSSQIKPSYSDWDIVIFGENHVSRKHLGEEMEIINEMKPGYFLLEALGNFQLGLLKNAIPAAYVDLKHDLLDKILDKDDHLTIEKTLKGLYSKELVYLEESKSILNGQTLSSLSESEARKLTAEKFNEMVDRENKIDNYMEMRNFTNKHKSFDDMISTPLHEFPMGYLFKVRDALIPLGYEAMGMAKLANSILWEKKRISESGANDIFQLLSAAYQANKDVKIAGISLDSSELFSLTSDERTHRMGQSIAKYAAIARDEGKKTFVVLGANHAKEGSPLFYYLNQTGLSYKVFITDPDVSEVSELRYRYYIEEAAAEELNKHKY